MTYPTDDAGHVRVDFVWGNFPLQPDQERGENTLDPALDNHSIATQGYSNYPSFIPNYNGLQQFDALGNVINNNTQEDDGKDAGLETVVPNVRGLKPNDAEDALSAASLSSNVVWTIPVVTRFANVGKVATVVLDDTYGFVVGDVVSVYYNNSDVNVSGNVVGANVTGVDGATLTLKIKETIENIDIETTNSYVYANYTGAGEVRYVLTQSRPAESIANVGDTVTIHVLQNND